ncbi:MAG: photosystem II S4 domain protein [Cyanobium sp. CZS 48M]|nr:photosystem II S4 domain protein [Cyanobium sp. CZS48M]
MSRTPPGAELLRGSHDPDALEPLIALAEQALRDWQPHWSGFLSAVVREEAMERLGSLSELQLEAVGGRPQAERCRLLLLRHDLADGSPSPVAPLAGLEVSGNFLFDPAEPGDVRSALLAAGALDGELGDLWLRGDRGAQVIVAPELANRLGGGKALVRSVEVELEARELDQLQPPTRPQPRQLATVEASLRLDAVASAGFGISRSRMAELVRSGATRVNWQPVTTPSRDLRTGDRIQLENRGELTVISIQSTKRQRWRLELQRH